MPMSVRTDAHVSLSLIHALIIACSHPPQNPLVQPVLTPRFVPTCSATLLQGLGDIAAETQAHVQVDAPDSDAAFGCAYLIYVLGM